MTDAGTVSTATILFSDMVASTAMRVALGDAAANEVRRKHDSVLTSVIERHGGRLVKSLGDGLMASFTGSAEAVAAAIDMQREIDRGARRVADDSRIAIRIGLSAGDVTWEAGDCHGTPVVTAARLCDAADAGQVLCDELVRGLARGRIDLTFAFVGELDLKGLAAPVMGFDVPWAPASLEVAPLPGPLRPVPGESPYAGRPEERARLTELWKAAQADGGSLVLIAGEPGIGKSRLVSELARGAHADGALVLLGRCDEHIPAPYAPGIELLRTLVGHAEEELLVDHVRRHGGVLRRLAPELDERVADVPAVPAVDADTERLLLFDAVVGLLVAAGRRAPVMLVIDDAHWADSGSVGLLRHLVSRVDDEAPILTLVTFRDTDIDRSHALSAALGDLHRAARAERISLKGLDRPGIRVMLEGTAGHDLDRDEDLRFVDRLAEETEGNPFFISEVLRHMVETGILVEEGGRWVGTVSSDESGIPEGVRDVVGQRLSRFSAQINDLLRTAAVIGREFDLAPLARIVGRSEDEVVDDLDEAIAARLVNEVEDAIGRLSFEHALVRQTLLEELSTNKRIRLHRKIAEELDGRSDTPIDVLAHHYCEAAMAGVAERAVEVAREAARAASDAFSWDEAVRLLERAREALDAFADAEPGVECDLLTELAFVEHGRGGGDAARAAASRAARLAREIVDPVRLGDAGRAYQGDLGIWARPNDEVGIAFLRDALDVLPAEEVQARARVSAGMAHSLLFAPGSQALDAADAAIEAAERAGDDVALNTALVVRAWAVRGTLPVDARVAAAERSVDVAVQNGLRSDEMAAKYLLGGALIGLGDLDGAERTYAEASDFSGAMEGWALVHYHAARAFAEGRFAEGEELSRRAHELGFALGESNDALRMFQAGMAALALGDFDTARERLTRGGATSLGSVTPVDVVLDIFDDPSRVPRHLRQWAAQVEPKAPNLLKIVAAVPLARAAFAVGEFAGLERYASYLDGFGGEFLGSDSWLSGANDWCRGLFAAVDGRLDDAVDLVTLGHEMHVDLGLHARVAESGLDLGLILRQRDRGDDREQAASLLSATEQLATRLGMKPTAESARAARG